MKTLTEFEEEISPAMKVLLDNIETFTHMSDRDKRLMSELSKAVYPNLLAHHTVGVQPASLPLTVDNGYGAHLHKICVRYNNEPETVNRMNIFVDRATAFIRHSKLATCFEFDGGTDTVFVEKVAKSIVAEIDSRLLSDLFGLATPSGRKADGTILNNLRFGKGEDHAYSALVCHIRSACSLIAKCTRRGAGNWCVVGDAALKVLRSTGNDLIEAAKPSEIASVPMVATLHGGLKVFHCPWLDQNPYYKGKILVGFKGSEIDAGYFYVPAAMAVPLTAISPMTFLPVLCFKTVSGKHYSRDGLSVAGSYYKTIDFET